MNAHELHDAFQQEYGRVPRLFAAQGRVNLIGEHTDYNDGYVFPMALEYRTVIAAAPRGDRTVRARSVSMPEPAAFSLDDNSRRRDNWSDYTAGVARILELEGRRLKGANLLIASSIPIGAGLSSSAAIEIASALAFLSGIGGSIDRKDLALVGQRAENEFVGMHCGIMDQFISACGERDHALFLDCRSLAHRQVPLPSSEIAIVICNTMVKHELAASEYNKRRAECEEGVRLLKKALPAITALRDVSVADLEKNAGLLPEAVMKRCRHVVTEDARVLDAVAALDRHDVGWLGTLMDASHESLTVDYEVSCPELDRMVAIAQDEDGCLGARMTGGGFGGCTVNLVQKNAVEAFRANVAAAYAKATGKHPEIYVSAPAQGAHEIT